IAIVAVRDDREAFGAMSIARVHIVAPVDAASVHVHLGAVSEGVFDGISIKILIDVRSALGADLVVAPAEGLRFDRPRILHPAEMINVMDVKIIETAAAGPEEAMEVPNLPEQFTRITGPLRRES